MKKFFYSMMALALGFAAVACSDDDDNTSGGGGNNSKPVEVLYSFSQKAYILGQSTEVTVELLNRTDASPIVANEDITVNLFVDEASTAVEGQDFTIGSKTAVIAKGSNKCTFILNSIADEVVETPLTDDAAEETEEHNSIVLGAQFQSTKYTFTEGAFPVTYVTIVGSMVNDLYGTWVMNELVTTPEVINDGWGYEVFSEADGFPTFNAEDKFVFEAGTLKTTLATTWKNYFAESSEFTIAGEYKLRLNMFETAQLQLIELKNVNRFFSATEQSEDKVALLGLRNIQTEDGATLLDVYVIDYESHSFAGDLLDFGMYEPTKPSAAMTGVFLNFTLKKAE